MVSVSFSGIFPSVRPLKKAGGIADRARYKGRTFVRIRYHLGSASQRPISHSPKGDASRSSKMEHPFPGRRWNKTEHPYRSQSRPHLFCPFLPEHGGKVGFDLLQLGGSGFLLPVIRCKARFSRKSGLHFPLAALEAAGSFVKPCCLKIPHRRFIQRQVCVKCFPVCVPASWLVFSPSWAGLVLR